VDDLRTKQVKRLKVLYLFLMVSLFVFTIQRNDCLSLAYGATDSNENEEVNEDGNEEGPVLTADNDDLAIELVSKGLDNPTTMAFLDVDEMLVLEKNQGTVRKIVDNKILEEPLLEVNVAGYVERGLLGIAIGSTNTFHNGKDTTKMAQVFLYFTEASNEVDCLDGHNKKKDCMDEGVLGHRLYKYELKENRLINPKLILDIPGNPGTSGASHIGGVLAIGPDKNIYLMTGDGESCQDNSCKNGIDDTLLNTQSANVKRGHSPEGRGGILRVTQDGQIVNGKGILGDEHPLDMYYAYGIRNGFGMDFDPVTGYLWDTENGPGFGDEINLVEPGFNSGWAQVAGIWPITNYELLNSTPEQKGYFNTTEVSKELDNLVKFNNTGKYSSPELSFNETKGITAIKFLNSDKLGNQYENDMFVGDVTGNLYHFNLNENRTKIELEGQLADGVANSTEELDDVIIAKKFPPIVDLEVSPDGYLYILSYDGSIFKMFKDQEKRTYLKFTP
jgi:aldose sugar dehydrogenase